MRGGKNESDFCGKFFDHHDNAVHSRASFFLRLLSAETGAVRLFVRSVTMREGKLPEAMQNLQ